MPPILRAEFKSRQVTAIIIGAARNLIVAFGPRQEPPEVNRLTLNSELAAIAAGRALLLRN